jgi:hypothetical protein
MFRDEFGKLDKLIRSMSASRWTRLAMIRSAAQHPWLEAELERLYATLSDDGVRALSDEEATEWLAALVALESQLLRVERAIPFERKLRPMMRPFRQRFQTIIRLRNALNCGIALLRHRLGLVNSVSLRGVRLSADEVKQAMQQIQSHIPAWQGEEMRIYDSL